MSLASNPALTLTRLSLRSRRGRPKILVGRVLGRNRRAGYAKLVGSAVNITRLYPRITRRGLWRERNDRLTTDETDAMKILENGRYRMARLSDLLGISCVTLLNKFHLAS